jgi:hypothetical protein
MYPSGFQTYPVRMKCETGSRHQADLLGSSDGGRTIEIQQIDQDTKACNTWNQKENVNNNGLDRAKNQLATSGGLLDAVVTMFFLHPHGMGNLAALVEPFAGNSCSRPSFRGWHWAPALTAALACCATTILVEPQAAVIAAVLLALPCLLRTRRVPGVRYGDARWGFTCSHLRANSQPKVPIHPNSWQPMIPVLNGNPEDRMTMGWAGGRIRYAPDPALIR